MINLQQEFIKADSERDILQNNFRRFQNNIGRVIAINRFKLDSNVK